jgi:hypothetical protein
MARARLSARRRQSFSGRYAFTATAAGRGGTGSFAGGISLPTSL